MILVVDDEPALRRLLTRVLTMEGYSTADAANAEDARRQLDSRTGIRLVMTDVDMPGESDGLDLVEYLGHWHPGLPVIVLTGNPGVANDPRLMQLASVNVLAKPVGLKELISTVNAVIAPPIHGSESCAG